MGIKGETFINDYLQFLFNSVAIANIADNAASGLLTDLYVSLHTDDPTVAGDQDDEEADYAGYARVAVTRAGTSGWTVDAMSVENAATIVFPLCTAGTNTVTHWALGTASSGAGKLLYTDQLTDPLAVSVGIRPTFAAGAFQIDES
jgi:hypothetical protein